MWAKTNNNDQMPVSVFFPIWCEQIWAIQLEVGLKGVIEAVRIVAKREVINGLYVTGQGNIQRVLV